MCLGVNDLRLLRYIFRFRGQMKTRDQITGSDTHDFQVQSDSEKWDWGYWVILGDSG